MEQNKSLNILFSILRKTEYFLESVSLLEATFKLDRKLKTINIGIDEFFEYEFLDLRSELCKEQFFIENCSGGYKITGKDILVNVLVFKDVGDRLVYRNKDIQDRFNKNFVSKKDLYPLKTYKYKNTLIKGPNNPYDYLERVYNLNKQNIKIDK